MNVIEPFFDHVNDIAAAWAEGSKSHVPEIDPHELAEATLGLVRAASRSFREDDDAGLRYFVEDLARSWREADVTSRQMGRFLRVLAAVVVERNPQAQPEDIVVLNEWLDDLLLWSLEARLSRLNTIVEQQREEMEELSTPFIELYRGVAVLPLVGTLDTERAERVMETLLQGIEQHDSRIVVVDITGVPTVDAFVAGRLVKTVEAARLMGAHCILSGLGSEIALTMVRLGVDLSVVETTSQLSDALERAFKKLGLRIVAA